MAESQVKNKHLLQKLQDLLERNPETYDVTFCVGPEKKLVRGIKVILKAASPVFERQFEEKWNVKVMKEENGIPLPGFDGNAFELFIKLTMSDTWNLTSLKDLILPPNEILNLITICRHFEMSEGLKNLIKTSSSFFSSFTKFHNSTDFLQLSRENLQTVVASEEITVREFEIFEAACRWAVANCEGKNIEISGKNLRQVLGSCLNEIRFPLMTNSEFAKVRQFHNILTSEESLMIYDFIGSDKTKISSFYKAMLDFKTEPRMHCKPLLKECKRVCLTNEFKIVDNPPFECDRVEFCHFFIPSTKIAIHGLGFLGPIDKEGMYNVSCRIWDCENGKYLHKKKHTLIWAKKDDKIFHWMFDQPIIVEPREFLWEKNYQIWFSLHGPPTLSVERQRGKESRFQEGESEFLFAWYGNQLAEILYKNV